jgi:chromosome segregation ATPase
LELAKLKGERTKELEASFENISETLGKSTKEIQTISNNFKAMRANQVGFETSQERIAKQYGISRKELDLILENTTNLSKEDAKVYEEIRRTKKEYENLNKRGQQLLDIEKLRVLTEKEALELAEALSDAKDKTYTDQNEAVQKILNNHKTEKEVLQDKLDFIDDQIDAITTLALKESKFKDDQKKAVALLLEDKQDLIDADLKGVEDVTEANEGLQGVLLANILETSKSKNTSSDLWLDKLETQGADEFDLLEIAKRKALKLAGDNDEDIFLITKYYENEKTKLTQTEADKQKIINQKAFDSFIGVANTSIDLFGVLLDGFQKEDLS